MSMSLGPEYAGGGETLTDIGVNPVDRGMQGQDFHR